MLQHVGIGGHAGGNIDRQHDAKGYGLRRNRGEPNHDGKHK